MKQKGKVNSSERSLPVSIAWGLLMMILLSLVGLFVGTSIINSGNATVTIIKINISALWLLSSLLGCAVSAALAKKQILIVCLGCVIGYIAILSGIQIIFFDSDLSEIWMAMLICVIGALPAILLNTRNKAGTHQKKRIRFR